VGREGAGVEGERRVKGDLGWCEVWLRDDRGEQGMREVRERGRRARGRERCITVG
jgi:hypothetical protein